MTDLPLLTRLFGALLFAGLLALTIIDLRTYRLPNALTFPLVGLGVIQAFVLDGAVTHSLLGAAIAYLVFVGIEVTFKKLRGVDGLGRGDAKLLAAGGAWCGWMALPYIILIGSLMGIAAAFLPTFRRHKDGWIPFGPFLALGIFLTWTAGRYTGL